MRGAAEKQPANVARFQRQKFRPAPHTIENNIHRNINHCPDQIRHNDPSYTGTEPGHHVEWFRRGFQHKIAGQQREYGIGRRKKTKQEGLDPIRDRNLRVDDDNGKGRQTA